MNHARFFTALAALASFTLFTAAMPIAWAHPGHDGGWVAGLTHPFLGWDHVLVLLAVGLLAARLAGRAALVPPLVFVTANLAGGLLGHFAPGVGSGVAEALILMSLVTVVPALFSTPALFSRPVPGLSAASVILLALVGLAHGHAHVTESGGATPAYFAGFLLATGLLHAAGWVAGRHHAAWRARGGAPDAGGHHRAQTRGGLA